MNYFRLVKIQQMYFRQKDGELVNIVARNFDNDSAYYMAVMDSYKSTNDNQNISTDKQLLSLL